MVTSESYKFCFDVHYYILYIQVHYIAIVFRQFHKF